MIDRLLHTPDGVRDTLNDECQKKQSLERELHKVLVSFGYRDPHAPSSPGLLSGLPRSAPDGPQKNGGSCAA